MVRVGCLSITNVSINHEKNGKIGKEGLVEEWSGPNWAFMCIEEISSNLFLVLDFWGNKQRKSGGFCKFGMVSTKCCVYLSFKKQSKLLFV